MTERPDASRARLRAALAKDRYPWIALVAANLLPLALVLAGQWTTPDVLLVYWAENLVIGGYSLLRILLAGKSAWGERIFCAIFFTFHYGGFCLGHGVLLVFMFRIGAPPDASLPSGGLWLGIFGTLPEGLWLPVALLAASHGVSFVRYYLLGGERAGARSLIEMARPYGRVVVMHLVVLLGAFIFQMLLGAPIGALLLLIVLKTAFDLLFHLRSHRDAGAGA